MSESRRLMMNEFVKPQSNFKSALPMATMTVLTALLMGFAVKIFISWRPAAKASVEQDFSSVVAPDESRKLAGMIDSSIELISDYKSEHPFTIRGTIHSQIDLDQLHYAWQIPPDVRVISGSTRGSSEINGGQTVQLELEVISLTPGPKEIALRSSTRLGNKRIGHVAVFLTEEHEPEFTDADAFNKTETKLENFLRARTPRSPAEYLRRAIH